MTLLLSLLFVIAAVSLYFMIRTRHVAAMGSSKHQGQSEDIRNHVLELLARGAPLTEILETIISGVELEQPSIRCSIQLLDREGGFMMVGAAPSLPESFCQALQGLQTGLGIGSSGTAAFTGQRVVVEDIRTHSYWETYRDKAIQAGLAACWSEPILSTSGKVLGTFDVYYPHAGGPTQDDEEIVERAVNLAGIALGRNHADQALRENEQLLSDILENVTACIYMKDVQGRYLFANRLLRERLDAPMEEIAGYDDSKFYDADTAAAMRRDDLRVLQKGEKLEKEEVIPNILAGVTHVFWTVKLPLRREDGSIHALCGISTDITERKDIEEHMRHMAQYDTLTHLPNRALFDDRLRQALAAAQRNRTHLGLMFIDLDKFKPVNDTYGHDVGDLLLFDVSQRIQDCLRESDTAARIGGDEFVVLLPYIEAAHDAEMVGRKILDALRRPFEIAGHVLEISSSIGVAVYPEHGNEEKLLVKSADVAMYHAKKNGRSNVKMYQPGLQDIGQDEV